MLSNRIEQHHSVSMGHSQLVDIVACELRQPGQATESVANKRLGVEIELVLLQEQLHVLQLTAPRLARDQRCQLLEPRVCWRRERPKNPKLKAR